MSVLTAGKTVSDSIYAYRFIRLMQKKFSEWEAFKTGIIDDKGNVLRRPKTDEEKSSYTPFHGAVRSLKKMVSAVPGASTWATISGSISAIGARFGMSESDIQMVQADYQYLYEAMVAGDSGGNPTNIASGTTTGAVVNAGPEVIGKKKKKPVTERYHAVE